MAHAYHSCIPNAALVDPKIELSKYAPPDSFKPFKKVLVARRDIAEGEEITVSFLSGDQLLESLERRQERLAYRGVDCHCQRCEEGRLRDPLRSFRCSSSSSCLGTH